MKTILCPIDFTPLSDRLLKYVAKLAADRDVKIALMAAQTQGKKVAASAWNDDRYDHVNKLGEVRDMINAKYHVHCSVQEDLISSQPYKQISLSADRFDLTVLGVSSERQGEQVGIAGLDPVKIIQDTLAPVMIVPDKYNYSRVTRLLYAHDYKHEPEPQLMTLRWLADWFDADIQFISVVQSNVSVAERNHAQVIHRKISTQWNSPHKLTFDIIVGADVSDALDHYMHSREPGDQLVLSVNHQNLLRRLWYKSTIKGLLHYASHPYIIIHR